MNKAFVREPEDTGKRYCPRCGALGEPVGRATLEAHLRAESLGAIADVAYFCPTPNCDVAYFDEFDRAAGIDALLRPVYPKDRDAPICGCFGLCEEDIEADLAAGAPTRVRAHLVKTKTDDAHCETAAANGRSCTAAVQKYYLSRANRGK
ncbi:MAG: hypothetical protein WD875_05240 [Pirellulales bacterium]